MKNLSKVKLRNERDSGRSLPESYDKLKRGHKRLQMILSLIMISVILTFESPIGLVRAVLKFNNNYN